MGHKLGNTCFLRAFIFNCLLLFSLVQCQDEEFAAQLSTTIAPEAEQLATTLNPIPIESEPLGNCATTNLQTGDCSRFDLNFVNATHSKLIPLLNEDEVCEIDALIDQILPEDYQVAANFQLGESSHVAHINETFLILNRLVSLAHNYSATFSPIAQRVFTRLSFLLYEVQLSPQCMASLHSLITATSRNELWAMKFIDSSGKLPNGFLEGVLTSTGDYEECLNIHSPVNEETGSSFAGQYCFLQPVLPHPNRHTYTLGDKIDNKIGLPPHLIDEVVDALYLLNGSLLNIGICLPSTCRAEEIETSLNTILYPITQIPLRVGPECSTKERRQLWVLDEYQRMALYILGSLFAVTVFASLLECIFSNGSTSEKSDSDLQASQVAIKMVDTNNNNGNDKDISGDIQANGGEGSSEGGKTRPSLLVRLVVSFSLVGNTRAMFRVSPNKFASIDFVRFLMLLQIMYMHQYYVALGWSSWPLTKRFQNGLIQKAGTDLKYAFLRNIHNTDFFFALTGLLLTYSTLRSLERTKGHFNYFTFVINMYLRFYPAVFGAILFFYLLPLAGSGPFWHLLDKFHVDTCRKTLMESMLTYNFYILDLESFYHTSMCNIATWWVNSCFHLILLSPLLILPLYYTGHALWLVLSVLLFGSAFSAGHIWYKGIPFMNQLALMNSILEESFYSLFYTWPFIHHVGPFTAGILVGYLIRRHPKVYLGGAFGETLLSIVFVGLSALGFYWTQDMLKSSSDIVSLPNGNSIEVYLNVTVGKLMFCAGFLWIFYLCCTNRSAWLTRLFTWPTLQPLYSLSLGIYLTNFIPPLFINFSASEVIEFTDFLILKNATFNFVLTVILSYILHVLFEKPMMNLLKIIESG